MSDPFLEKMAASKPEAPKPQTQAPKPQTATEAGLAAAKALGPPVLRVKRLVGDAKLPTKGSAGAAGLDLYAAGSYDLPPGTVVAISTGLAMALPEGTVGLIRDRSSLAKEGVTTHVGAVNAEALRRWLQDAGDECFAYQETVLGGVGDADYRGEWRVLLINTSDKSYRIEKGERVAQLVIVRTGDVTVEVTEGELDATDRGAGGFGSTGK